MSTSTKFLSAYLGKQTAFGTPVAASMKVPLVGDYEDAQEEHSAEWDAGYWTPTTIVAQVAQHARFTLNGTGFFELLPVLFNAGHDHITPTGVGPYSYDDAVAPGAVGVPRAYTAFFGGNENIGATGPMIRVRDCHLEAFSLAGNINTKEVALTSQWYGASIDDNSGAGFARPTSALPAQIGMMRTLLATLELEDATVAGGAFTTMTATDKALLDWQFDCDFGLRPLWAAEENQLFYSGVRHQAPVAALQMTLRTNQATYAVVRRKAELRTYQELQLTLNGGDAEQLVLKLTGRFLPTVIAHARSNDEVVMAATFQVETPHTQITTPHWMSWTLDTNVSI